MRRLYILVEGQTEEAFVKNVPSPHLRLLSIEAYPIIVATSRDPRTGRKQKGGGHWKQWKRDLRRLMLEQANDAVRFTTLFDLYGLPRDFPGIVETVAIQDSARRADSLQGYLEAEIADRRLIAYVQRHEFESLVLASLEQLKPLLDPTEHRNLDDLQRLVVASSPEDLNDGSETAPSKRLEGAIPSYEKTTHGPLAVEAAGINALRAACPRFGGWLNRLEELRP